MYKVFLNDRVIVIGAGKNITINQPAVTFSSSCNTEEIISWFNAFESSNLKEVFILHEHPGWFFERFKRSFKVIQAAGGVVVSDNQLLFIFRHGKWDLPKGKKDPQESIPEAALREVEEETGIQPGGIDHRLPSTYHIYQSPYNESTGTWIFKETFWFQMNYHGKLAGKPQQEEGITQVKWIPATALEEVLANTYENLKQVIFLYRP